jgi:hypothetical protein
VLDLIDMAHILSAGVFEAYLVVKVWMDYDVHIAINRSADNGAMPIPGVELP